jgi:SP family myo-inositol transporter-like MFS transporter 13
MFKLFFDFNFMDIIWLLCDRYYSASIIKMSGVSNQHTAIWLAAMTAGVNFVFTLVGVWLVERIGRRRLILCSLAGTSIL